MAAAGGGAADLAEQIRLLREQNRLLVQQNEQLSLQGGDPRVPRAQRRRFVDAPSLDDPEDDRVFLIPAQLERGANAHRIPTDAAGALGEPHLLNVTSEHVYLHAIEKGKSHDATILRVLISALTYAEVLESGLLLARERASTFEGVATGAVQALEAVLGPEPAPPADGGDAAAEAARVVAEQRKALRLRIEQIEAGAAVISGIALRAAGTIEGVRSLLAYGEGLHRTHLLPEHLVPHFLKLAVETAACLAACSA